MDFSDVNFFQMWNDTRLKWSTSSFPIETLRRSASTVWTPEVILKNGITGNIRYRPSKSEDLIITNDGTVMYERVDLFKLSCGIHIRQFPRDVQTCTVEFMTSKMDFGHIMLNTLTE